MVTKQCLEGFRSVGEDKCVYPCPQGFNMITENNTYKCVHNQDKKYQVILNPVGATAENISVGGMVAFRRKNPSLYDSYLSERTRVEREIETINREFPKEKQLENAFKDMQTAENVRDVDPQGYQNARIRYYTLLKGESWRDQEKERIAKVEIEPLVNKYSNQIRDTLAEISNQTLTIDVAKGVKDNVLSIKDELNYATTTFQKQLTDLKSAIVMEHRKQEQKKEKDTTWVDLLLNVLTVIILIVIVIIIVRKFVMKTVYTSPPSSVVNI